MKNATDFLLFQVDSPREQGSHIASNFLNFCITSSLGLTAHRAATATEKPQIYLYAKLPSQTEIELEGCLVLEALFHKVCGQPARVSRLQLALQPDAVSHRETPKFHYVVETDADDNWFEKIAKWYDEEHMPGLAGVPGCVSAMRLVNLDAKNVAGDNRPRSFACYDLTSPDVLGSPPWLAVRHTAWSDVARPHFKNTLRTMMEIIEP
jgi:hypothetical protein